ncbi:hypothetical protein A33M_2730 [Rhodovulum sp. PH10]|nr:hypothetical protein A33M_2730 [Rhodovulum sp. PH10]
MSPTVEGYLAGLRAGVTSVFLVVLVGTFISIGALAHDLGFPALWVVLSTLLIWAGPAQVIMISALGAGAAPFEVAVAVSLSSIRLLPMVVALLPIVRAKNTRWPGLLLATHFVAVSAWIEALRLAPGQPRENRVAFVNGIGTVLLGVSTLSTAAGYYLALAMPRSLVAGMLFLTPMSFLVSVTRSSRMLSDRLAAVIGLVVSPILVSAGVGLDLMWTGVVGGSVAYLVHRWWSRRREGRE